MSRGTLRIFLGAVAGVGKTYAALNECWRRRQRGTDVVIGYVEAHGRAETAAQVRDLEVIPRRTLTHGGASFEEMDIDAVLTRRPQLAFVDELAHSNVPGSRNAKRWQDVQELLEAGIDVVSTLNIQHLESLNDVVFHITGVRQQETIPDAFVRGADEVQLAEMNPEALRRRLAHGDIYAADKIDAALSSFFRPGNLGALRELALLWLADRVEESLHDYLVEHGIAEAWETRERTMVALTGAPHAERFIRRAARMARRSRAELIGVHVVPQDGLTAPAPANLVSQRTLLGDLGGRYIEVEGDNVADALLQVARAEHVTQVVVGASRRSRWEQLTRGSVIERFLRGAGTIDVHVISYDAEADWASQRVAGRRLPALTPRRQQVGFAVGVMGLSAVTLALGHLQNESDLSSVLLLYLLAAVVASAVGGRWPGIFTAAIGFLLGDYFFTRPFRQWTIADTRVVIALVVFVLVTATVSSLVDYAARRRREAERARTEAAALAQLSRTVLDSDEPLHRLVHDLRSEFALDSVAVLRREGDGWQTEVADGSPVPAAPDDGTDSLRINDDLTLVLSGHRTPADDRRVFAAFAAQLAVAVAQQQLASQAAEAQALAKANDLRTALLSAVSHDLRTPLSTIKAWTTSLLSDDVDWPPEERRSMLLAVVEEVDRLDDLVGNLLDLSRLQTGGMTPTLREVTVDEILPGALAGLDADSRVHVDVPHDLPHVRTDAAMLERVIANLVMNALRYSPTDQQVFVRASAVGDEVELRVVDHGPGIPTVARDVIFDPFQRLGDSPDGAGLGLGLAVARGLTDAIGGELTVDDTPAGGATMVLRLQVAS